MIDAKIAVYTCILPHNYAKLAPPTFINPDKDQVHYWAILDESIGIEPWWELLVDRDRKLSPRQDLQKYKMLSHKYLPEYDWVIWVDGNTRLLVDPVDIVNEVAYYDHKLAFGVHPWRTCSYEEGKVCAGFASNDGNAINFQMERYKELGLPENYGLVASTFFVRNNKDEKVKEFFETWLDETMLLGFHPRNQISFGIAAFLSKVQYLSWDIKWGSNRFYRMYS